MNVQELLQLVAFDYELKNRASAKVIGYQTKHLVAALGDVEAERLSAQDVEGYQVERLRAGAARKTIDNECGILRRGVRLAIQKRMVHRSEPYIGKLGGGNVRTGVLTPDEFFIAIRMLETVDLRKGTKDDHPVADAIRWSYHTGWRRAMVLGLVWVEVDQSLWTVHLGPGRVKNREDFVLRCGSPQVEVLKRRLRYRVRVGGDYVFHRGGRRIVDFRSKWEHVRELLCRPDAVFHDCRRSFATNGEDAGLSQKEIMETGCWKDPRMVNYYSQVKQRRQKKALERVGEYVSDKGQTGAAQ